MTFFWATYEQQGNTIALWADDYTDTINLMSGPDKSRLVQAFSRS